MQPTEIYHIYNHANGFENLFREHYDYSTFLERILKYTNPVSDFFAYCLMPNHFHLLVKIKDTKEIRKTFIKGDPIRYISHAYSKAFNSYAQTYNHRYMRMGSLFNPNMKTKKVESEIHFCKIVHYIHSNPVHHGFTERMEDWKYSSYPGYLRGKKNWLDSEMVMNSFGNRDLFITYHRQPIGPKVASIY